MSLFTRFNSAWNSFFASDISTLSDPQSWLLTSLIGMPTGSGKYVSAQTAMRASAVLACIRILSEDLSSLPLHLFVRTQAGAQYALSHPLFSMLYESPNDEMTSQELREHMIMDALLTGGWYNAINYDNAGSVNSIVPLVATDVTPDRTPDGNLIFQYNDPSPYGTPTTFTKDQIWRGQLLSQYGITGRSVVLLAREAVGLLLAAEEQGAKLFSNGAQLAGYLQAPQGVELTDDQRKQTAESWKAAYSGSSNAFKTALLQYGLTYQKLSLTAQESQFIESRQFQTAQIADLFRVPCVKLASIKENKGSYNSAEQQELSYLKGTLVPWTVRIEQTITRDLLLPSERGRYYAKHNFGSFLRADTATRYAAYHQAINDGWMNRNEVRQLEELNTVPGLDSYLVPLNIGTARPDGTIANPNKEEPAVVARLRAIAEASAERIVRKETRSKKFDAEFVSEVMNVTPELAALYCADRESGKITDADARKTLINYALEELNAA